VPAIRPRVARATIYLVNLVDRRGHRHHGLWGRPVRGSTIPVADLTTLDVM
jgi:hypothetical protein